MNTRQASLAQTLRKLGVDELVGDDPGRRASEREHRVHGRRRDHDRAQHKRDRKTESDRADIGYGEDSIHRDRTGGNWLDREEAGT